MHLKDKIAIVTGGSRGIGKEICLKFASLGANLVINYIGDKTQAEDTKAECEKLGAKVALSEGDVSKMADCEKLFQTAVDTFGRVDILVNNAGITRDNLLMRMSEEEFDAVIAVNLKGTFNCMKQAARPMMKQKYGKIINMASVVNAIAPGFIRTAMTDVLSDDVKAEITRVIPMGVMGETEDVANLAAFLASDASRYITGQVINVDGGMVM